MLITLSIPAKMMMSDGYTVWPLMGPQSNFAKMRGSSPSGGTRPPGRREGWPSDEQLGQQSHLDCCLRCGPIGHCLGVADIV